jgi:AsmA protein
VPPPAAHAKLEAVSEIDATQTEVARTPLLPRAAGEGVRHTSTARRPLRARKSAPAQRRSGLSGIIVYLLLGFACLAVAVASFVVLANPADIVRDRLIAQAKARLDRDVIVGGGASLTYFPFGVVLRDVVLSAHDTEGPPLVRAAAVGAHVSLLSLLGQRLTVSGVTITQPEINLAIDPDGRRNWEFASSDSRPAKLPVRLAQLAPRFGFGKDVPPDMLEGGTAAASARDEQRPGNAKLDHDPAIDVRMQDGTVRYSDARTGATRHLSAVNLRIGLNDSARHTQVSGGFTWMDEPVSVKASVSVEGEASTQADVHLKSRALDAVYRGRLASAGAGLDGHLVARAPSLEGLVRWIKGETQRTEPGIAVAFDGRVKHSGALLEFADASLTANGTTTTGAASIDVSGPKPVVRADLKLAALDLDRAPVPEQNTGLPAPVAKQAGKASSIDDLLNRTDGAAAERPAPEHMQQTAPDRTTRPLDLSALRWADLDGRIEIGKLRWHGLSIEALRATTTIVDGHVTANVTEAKLYGGHGNATLIIEPKGAERAAASVNATIEGAAAQALLKDLLHFDWIDGQGQLILALSAEGGSEQEIVDGLHGRAEIKVAEGALVGWDLNQMLRGLRQGHLPATDREPSARTRFGELTGSFAIAEGVAQNEDLKVTGGAVTLSGSGSVVYRDRTINYTVRSKLAQPAGGLEDIEIPVRIYGSWEKPVLSPDLDGVLKDPRTAAKVQQLGRNLRSGNVDEALKSVLGEGPEAEKKKERAKSILKRFLKQ